MKYSIKMIPALPKLSACFLLAVTASCSGQAFETFRLYQVTDLQRVFEDGYNLPVTGDTIHAFGIRGEVLSAQCVLVPDRDLTGVTVELGELKDRNTGRVLPEEGITWNFVGSVPLSENAPNQPLMALSRPAPASFPEFLMDDSLISISQGIYLPIWLTVQIPENARAGLYAGEVTVKTNRGEGTLPMVIEVFPLVLPAERHLNIVEWYSTDGFARFHGIEEEYSEAWFSMLGKYAENMVAHRQNTFRVPMSSIQIRRTKSGSLEFDFSLFDRIARVFWNTGRMDYLETGFLTEFGEEAWFSTEILLKDILVSDTETGEKVEMKGEYVIPHLLPAFENHLQQQGWLDKTLFHIKDEPSIHNALAWKKMSSYIHQYAPSLRRIDAIETSFLLDEIEIAVPKLDALASWYDSFSRWQQEGNELWFYTVGIYQASCLPNKTIDMPLIDTRIMHWLNYKYDAAGYLHWGWNRWNEDPFVDAGQHLGDGWHVYPAREGVLNSLRWEQMRNGIQDYEYFWMLEDRIDSLKASLGSGFTWIDPSQRGKEIANAVVMSFAAHTGDPHVLYQAKREIIREILELDTSPKIYIQTDPVVNTAMTNRSTVAVLGWTETGTRITVNGKELPVREDGLFLEQFHLSPENSRITVQAVHPGGSKEIIREFVIGN